MLSYLFLYLVFQGDLPPLSPLPVVRHTPISPRRRISNNHSVYINSLSPMQGSTAMSPRKPLPYYFNRSPAKVSRSIIVLFIVTCFKFFKPIK